MAFTTHSSLLRTSHIASPNPRGIRKYNPTTCLEWGRIRNISEEAPMTIITLISKKKINYHVALSHLRNWGGGKSDGCVLSGCICTKVSPRAEWKELSSIILLNEVREIQRWESLEGEILSFMPVQLNGFYEERHLIFIIISVTVSLPPRQPRTLSSL